MIEELKCPDILYHFNQYKLSIDKLYFNKITDSIGLTTKNVFYDYEDGSFVYVTFWYTPKFGWRLEKDFEFNQDLDKLKENAYIKQLTDRDYKEMVIENAKIDIKRIEENIKYLKSQLDERNS